MSSVCSATPCVSSLARRSRRSPEISTAPGLSLYGRREARPHGYPLSPEYGAGGANTLSLVLAIEELARVDCALAITVTSHTSLGTMPIDLWGSDEQKAEWLPQLCSGQRLAAYGLTEPEAGSDAGNTQTTAKLIDGGGGSSSS